MENNEMMTREELQDKAYSLYQLDWMMRNRFSISDIFKELGIHISEGTAGDLTEPDEIADALEDDFLDAGFMHGALFVCKDEFLDNEYQDKVYMTELLNRIPGGELWKAYMLYEMKE